MSKGGTGKPRSCLNLKSVWSFPREAGRYLSLLSLLLSAAAPAQQVDAPTAPPTTQAPAPAPVDDWSDAGWDEIEQWAEQTSGEAVPTAEPVPEPASSEAGSSEFSSLQLVRRSEDGKERRIQVVRRGNDDASGIFAICNRRDDEAPETPSLAVFSESGEGGVEITIDKNVIRVPLALVTQKPQQGGQGGDGSIEAGGGAARFLEDTAEAADTSTDRLTRCGVAVQRESQPGAVKVTQGQTSLTGQSLKYDETDGIARIAGPISFERGTPTEGASEAQTGPQAASDAASKRLSGTAGSIEVEVDSERTVLVGDVTLNSAEGRVSRAARVEYDDAANLARLIGTPEQPAVTVRGNERLQAAEILYDLERDEAVAWASEGVRISGEFTDGE